MRFLAFEQLYLAETVLHECHTVVHVTAYGSDDPLPGAGDSG